MCIAYKKLSLNRKPAQQQLSKYFTSLLKIVSVQWFNLENWYVKKVLKYNNFSLFYTWLVTTYFIFCFVLMMCALIFDKKNSPTFLFNSSWLVVHNCGKRPIFQVRSHPSLPVKIFYLENLMLETMNFAMKTAV